MWWTALLVLVLTACGGGSPETDGPVAPDGDPISGTNQVMPAGVVGEPYEAQILAQGGQPPLTYEVVPELRLPLGLSMTGDGRVMGVPVEAGARSAQIIARDSGGRTQRFLASFEIDLQPTLIECGDSLQGQFTGSAILNSGPNWSAVGTPNLQWLGIPWPQGDNQRIELTIDAQTTVGLLVQRPNQSEGSLNWRVDYVNSWIGAGTDTIVQLDPGTLPSLPAYETQGLVPVVMVAFGAGAYRLDVTCSDGPVFRQSQPLPVRLGEEFSIDYEVYGDNSDVTFTIEGDLPEWVAIDEVAGTLQGTALEEVTVPLVVTAMTSDGRSRQIDSIFGVFDPSPIECGETRVFELEEGYFDGPVAGYFDPRGYQVFVLEMPAEASAVQWSLAGEDGQYLGLVEHDEDRFLFFGGADIDVEAAEPAEIEVSPRSYPATRHYRDAGQMYVVAGATGLGRELSLTASCDVGPRPNHAGLPVVETFVSIDEPLRGIGGVPPYAFAANGLPSGLSVSGGRLTGSSNQVGTYPVQLTVTDALGDSFTDTYELYVGVDEACDGGRRVECGDALQGEFSGTFFQEPSAQSRQRLCFIAGDVAAVGFEFSSDGGEYRLDVGDPGVVGSRLFDDRDSVTPGGVVLDDDTEAIALNAFSWPALPDYDRLPVHIGLRAVEPGQWSVIVVCDESLP